ncbi:putative Isoflavone reductase [Hibiscus syriacus]|uniref:Isoflavone reductase n=1 Tax=Hibiscus syriacus TaxID=106335 RepID=A0A6A3BVR5_HIBSY|nr:putative Isoflavone reductase [Hibiscus syriacus]
MELLPMRNMAKNKPEKQSSNKRVWRLKLSVTWRRIKNAMKSRLRNRLSNLDQLSTLKLKHHDLAIIRPIRHLMKKKKKTVRPAMPLAQLIRLPYTAADFIDRGDAMTPTKSPVENVSTRWRELHRLHDWDGLMEPLHPWLRREIVRYGEFVEATYDASYFDPLSEFCGSCRYNPNNPFEELGLTKHGYKGMLPSPVMPKPQNREGRYPRGMAGTVAPTEWYSDLRTSLQRLGKTNIKVQSGFLGVYCSKGEFTRYNKLSAKEQVMEEIRRLVAFFRNRGEEVSLTICGHSLGGALALLNACDAATYFPDLVISVISFAAPRVGNIHFKEKLNELGVKTLRVVIKQDIVPKLPCGYTQHKFTAITGRLKRIYRHVGMQLKLDMHHSPYLMRDPDYTGCHNLRDIPSSVGWIR